MSVRSLAIFILIELASRLGPVPFSSLVSVPLELVCVSIEPLIIASSALMVIVPPFPVTPAAFSQAVPDLITPAKEAPPELTLPSVKSPPSPPAPRTVTVMFPPSPLPLLFNATTPDKPLAKPNTPPSLRLTSRHPNPPPQGSIVKFLAVILISLDLLPAPIFSPKADICVPPYIMKSPSTETVRLALLPPMLLLEFCKMLAYLANTKLPARI